MSEQDPREAEPSPPFPGQPQEVPGIEARMRPQPDFGEELRDDSRFVVGRCWRSPAV